MHSWLTSIASSRQTRTGYASVAQGVATPPRNTRGRDPGFGGDYEPPSQRCPFNEGATGIGVRYGSYVDAVGLIRGTQPAVSILRLRHPVVVANNPAPPPADPASVIPAPSPASGWTRRVELSSAGNSYTMTISRPDRRRNCLRRIRAHRQPRHPQPVGQGRGRRPPAHRPVDRKRTDRHRQVRTFRRWEQLQRRLGA